MTYNFDEVIERRGTDSVKWDGVKSVWGPALVPSTQIRQPTARCNSSITDTISL